MRQTSAVSLMVSLHSLLVNFLLTGAFLMLMYVLVYSSLSGVAGVTLLFMICLGSWVTKNL